MAILGIETASTLASVAVVGEPDALLAERRWTLTGTVSQELLAQIDQTLREAGVERRAITAIAVDVGPGGYGGLRAGVATAQGMALALGIPLAGVSRLEALAWPHVAGGRPVVAVHAAGSGRIAWAAYVASGDDGAASPRCIVEPRMDDVEACVAHAPSAARWCGEIAEGVRDALAASERSGDEEATPLEPAPRASDLIRLARAHDAFHDPEAVDVVYLRPPSITRPRARTTR